MKTTLLLMSIFFCPSFVVKARSCLQGTALICAAFLPPHANSVVAQGRQQENSHQGESETDKTIVILYHKPPNVITSHSNADALPSHVQQRRTVYEDIQSMQGFVDYHSTPFVENIVKGSKLHAIGRLDADTTGLLLLTNDGGLVHHVTTSASILKTYEAVIMGGHWNDTSPAILQMKQNGVDIGSNHGGWTRPPHSLRVLDHPTHKSTRVELTISEGKNRQIRRMFHAIQSGVMKLKRTRIGDGLTLDDVPVEGQWRILTDEQVETHLGWKPRLLVNHSENHKRRTSRRGVASTRGRRRRR